MDRTKWPAMTGLVAGTVLLSVHTRTTFAFDKPIHTSILLLASCAACIIGVSRWLPKDGARSGKGQQYDAILLEEVDEIGDFNDTLHGHVASAEDVRYPKSLRQLRISFLILACAVCLRIELGRQVLANVQCARSTSWAPLVPLVFAAWDYWHTQRHSARPAREEPGGTLYDALVRYITRTRYRYLAAVGLISIANVIALSTTSPPYSTHICAASLAYGWLVPLQQHLGTVLDVVIIYLVERLLRQQRGRGVRSIALRFCSIAWALIIPAGVGTIVGILYYYQSDPIDRHWVLTFSSAYLWSVLSLDFLVSFTSICALFTMYHTSVLTTTLILTFVSTSTLTTYFAWSNPHPFPPVHSGFGYVASSVAILGFATYFQIETVSEHTTSKLASQSPNGASNFKRTTFTKVPSSLYLLLLILFLARSGIWAGHTAAMTYHPVDMLMYESQARHEAYVNQMSASTSLAQAVTNYEARYGRAPPPKFDEWYKYATARNSAIIDDFDSVYRDLLPFYSLSPVEIRQRSFQLIANPWNDAAGISIRDGKVLIGENVMPTHRWMLDGLVDMISKFAEWVPDMDLAFNLNDECRVAVSYESIEPMRQIGRENGGFKTKPKNEFSRDRAEQWMPVPDPPITETPLIERSLQKTFHEFGAVSCPPGTAARSQRLWDTSSLCTVCIRPHSLGAFLANWTLAADVCHQPDLADLHGIYLSPAAFKGTHELYPIFSQSKVGGFNDILYPSAWNYIDKAYYNPTDEYPDPPFAEKNANVFWRGATSEGLSTGRGEWKGMTRQRFIHLANANNGSNTPQALLLPSSSSKQRGKLSYLELSIKELTKLMSSDVKFVRDIARCRGRDCPNQAAEFAPLAEPTEFQAHWSHKYLLDLDGAGFSGRFLPFMHSRSLPFKAALFREWWDDRVTPWAHFVPLDIRGHGFWATLAYFAGLKTQPRQEEVGDDVVDVERQAKVKGHWVDAYAHERQAARIAEEGRKWAGKVLRKEDMEIYFFRLLLEWGRLTDDKRDEIGYRVDVG